MTTSVVAYTSRREGQVTRFISFRTSVRNVRAAAPPGGRTAEHALAILAAAATADGTRAGVPFTGSNVPVFTTLMSSRSVLSLNWQAKRESNPQPPVLETGALPIELLAFNRAADYGLRTTGRPVPTPGSPEPEARSPRYFVSRCAMCFRQNRQYLLNSSRSVVFFLFFVVL